MLEKRGILAENGAVRCTNVKAIQVLMDSKMLLSLGPRMSCNFLMKYLTFDA